MITVIAEEMRRWLAEMIVLYLAVVLIGFAILLAISYFGRMYAKYRGPKELVCPETGQTAVVEIDALHAALGDVFRDGDIRLLNCSLWKDGAQCHESCVKPPRLGFHFAGKSGVQKG